MVRVRYPFYLIIFSLVMIVSFQNCQKAEFSKSDDTPQTSLGNACEDVEAISRPTKILFLVDQSGSNVMYTNGGSTECSSNQSSCTPPTDPQKTFRRGMIQSFFGQYQHKTNFSWNISTFAGSSALALVNVGGNKQSPLFSTDINQMQTAINTFASTNDSGGTPFKAAIRLATKAVQNDSDRNSQAQFIVVLISDGYPTDYSQNGSADFDADAFATDIDTLLAAASGRVSLSTIYYGTRDNPQASGLLQTMAQMGGGQFANLNVAGSGLTIDDVIPGHACN